MTLCVVDTPHTGHIYFARFGSLIKIGYAESVGKRFDQHRKTVSDAIFLFSVRGSYERERAFHLLFQQYRQRSQNTTYMRYAEHFAIPDCVVERVKNTLSKEDGFSGEETRKDVSKQTVEIGRKAIGQIKRICTAKGMSFQEFAIHALNLALHEAGEPTIEEMEAEQ